LAEVKRQNKIREAQEGGDYYEIQKLIEKDIDHLYQ
jgi:hypothetical protein